MSENQRASSRVTKKVMEAYKFFSVKRLFTYFLGPFKNAKPTIVATRQKVVQSTNLEGATTMTPSIKNARKPKNPATQNEMIA